MPVSGILYTLEQFACSLCLLSALGRAVRIPRTSALRLLFFSLLAALASTMAAVYSSLRLPFLTLTLLLPSALWPRMPRRLQWRLPLLLLALTILLTGLIRVFHSFSLSPVLTLLLSLPILMLFSRAPSQTIPRCVTAEVTCGPSRLRLTALIDTGNLLRDPLTALPVVVISRQAALRLIPRSAPEQLNPGLRQISVRTIAGVSSMTVFHSTSLRLLHEGAWIQAQAMIGIAPDGYNGVQALVPACLLHPLSPSLTQGG